MSVVTVGTKRYDNVAGKPGPTDENGYEYGFEWVRIGDVVLTSADHCLMSVGYEADGNGFSKAIIELAPSSFTTVDHITEPNPPVSRRAALVDRLTADYDEWAHPHLVETRHDGEFTYYEPDVEAIAERVLDALGLSG